MPVSDRQEFAALLRQILVEEQKRKLKDVADAVGLSTRNFYGRVTGRIQFTPDEINRVIRAVPDARLGDWLLANSDLTCTPRVAPAPADAKSTAVDLALNGVEQGMAALRSVLAMDSSAEMSPGDLGTAETHILEAQRQLGALQMMLRARAHAAGKVPARAAGTQA